MPQPNDPTSGRDSLGKALRRNLSAKRVSSLLGRGRAVLREKGPQALARAVAFRFRLATHGEVWRYRADIPLRRELIAQRAARFVQMPLVSVVVPVYNTPLPYLKEMVASVRRQSYANWELVLADASDADHGTVGAYLQKQAVQEGRIRYLRLAQNEGISGNTNAAMAAARGDYFALLDHDDVLQLNALYENVKAINETGATLLYSDEIVLSDDLKRLGEYHFKPGYGPDTLRGCNYITHLCVFSAALLAEAGGGEDPALDGAQDYDLILRLAERAGRVHHIPKVLYFWRRHGGSTASGIEQKPAAVAAGAAAIDRQLERLGLAGTAEPLPAHPGAYRVRYAVAGAPLVSVLIPNKDHIEDLERCLTSLRAKAGWDTLEVLVLENNSEEAATFAYYEELPVRWPAVRVVRYEGGFNFAAICNLGAREARGTHLLLLNNDTEILSDGFVQEMLGYSQRPDVGAVGALLYYPDDTVQHAGLFVGIGGTAGVNHKGHARGDGGDLFRLCTVQNLLAVTGAALMVKKEMYEAVGGMDEEHFGVAYNDVDLCLKLAEAGYWNLYTPFAEAYHYESRSRGYDVEGPRKERHDREAAAFRARYAGVLAAGDPFYNPHFTLLYENYGYA